MALLFLATSTPDLPPKVAQYADQYHVSAEVMAKIIDCESSASTTIAGDDNQSFGLVQIFLPAHPEITKEEAIDPDFALNFMAENLSEGRSYLWTCARNLGL